jgi:hypothetical protein
MDQCCRQMFMSEIKNVPSVSVLIDVKGLSGQLATEILGETWIDDYMEYEYSEGDEHLVQLFIFGTCPIDDLFEDYGE